MRPEGLSQQDARAAVWRILEKECVPTRWMSYLLPRQQHLVRAYWGLGQERQSVWQLARHLGITQESVKARLRTAVHRLAREYQAERADKEGRYEPGRHWTDVFEATQTLF